MGAGRLVVDFIGDRFELEEHERLSFGRLADVELDTNQHLHRVVGRFTSSNGFWWLHNEGSAISVLVIDCNSNSSCLIAPGTGSPLTYGKALVRITAGRAEYEMEVSIESNQFAIETPKIAPCGLAMADVPLNADQRALLVVLAESRLRNPHGPLVLPTNAEAARRLGWSITKLNRKLDNLCVKFDKLGVSGLRGSVDRLASDRRRRLAEYCVRAGVVSSADLDEVLYAA